jgi:hypothetical protein
MHFVTGIIARPDLTARLAGAWSLSAPAALSEGLSLLPLRDVDIARLVPDPGPRRQAGFEHLSEDLLAVLAEASAGGDLAYVETAYFEGAGLQGAVMFRDGAVAFGPQSADIGPINGALAAMGVAVAPGAQDEYDTVGLGRHRSTEAWLKAM